MPDLSLDLGAFSSTVAKIAAVSEAGKKLLESMFGVGAVSVEIRKSEVIKFSAFAAERGVVLG